SCGDPVSKTASVRVVLATRTSPAPSADASRTRRTDARACTCVGQVRRSGANSRIPIASPTHHTDQTDQYADQLTSPWAARLATPLVALTSGVTPATATNRQTSRIRRNPGANPKRPRRTAPRIPAHVLPTAIPNAVESPS